MSAEIIDFRLRNARSIDDIIGQVRLFLTENGASSEKVTFVTVELKRRWDRVFEALADDPSNPYESALMAALFQMVALCLDLWDARSASS